MPQIPAYIEAADIRGAAVKHKWTSSAPIDRDVPKLWAAFNKTSMRGMLLLAAGTAEWVAWRFDGIADVTANLQFAEGVYAGIVEPTYTIRWEWPKGGDPTGPVHAPLAEANRLLSEAFKYYSIRSMAVRQKGARVVQLAQHVLPKKKPFEEWFTATLRRLAKLYPLDKHDVWGEPVPRQALDPKFAYDRKLAPGLLREFLQQLDAKKNPFLRPAKDMTKEGFSGTPYKL